MSMLQVTVAALGSVVLTITLGGVFGQLLDFVRKVTHCEPKEKR
jgi:uncharacterized membrane protein YdjX (TVP38/TMEM64 family)